MYFPESLCFEKESEFTLLTQGSMTVTQYEDRFTELSYFVPHLVATDSIMARRFEKGLRPTIRIRVRPMRLDSYREVVNVAKIIEQEMENMQQELGRMSQKRSRSDEPQYDQAFGSKKPERYREQPRCSRCGGFHSERDCRWFLGVCYQCGRRGHRAVDCRFRQSSRSRQPPRGVSRP